MSTPKANLVALADAVVAALAAAPAGTFAEAFTPAKKFAPMEELADLKRTDPPLVIVQPISDDESRQAKGPVAAWQGTYEVALVIWARVGVGDAAETRIGELMRLRGQIREYLKGLRLAVAGTVDTAGILMEIVASPAYSDAAVIEHHCFGSATGLRYTLVV